MRLFCFTFLLFFLCFLHCPSASSANTFLENNRKEKISKASSLSLSYQFKRAVVLKISINEMFGKNIKFKVLQDGKNVFNSGVRRGQAQGSVAVRPGTVSLVITNGHWLKEKYVLITVSYLPVVGGGSGIGNMAYLVKNQSISLPPGSSYAKVYDIMRRTRLFVKVSESFGKNIEFKVLQNGIAVYRSGIQKGGASATVAVSKGKVSVIIKNGNIFRKKSVYLSIGIPRKISKW